MWSAWNERELADGAKRHQSITVNTDLITDLVRTGDFEAVLSWAAGTTERVPFRVLALREPTRIVIDLEDP